MEVTRFVRKVAELDWEDRLPHHGKPERWVKFIFEVEVEGNGDANNKRTDTEPDLKVFLDPNEHQRYIWATEDEVRNEKVGEMALKYITPDNKVAKLEAFELRRVR